MSVNELWGSNTFTPGHDSLARQQRAADPNHMGPRRVVSKTLPPVVPLRKVLGRMYSSLFLLVLISVFTLLLDTG